MKRSIIINQEKIDYEFSSSELSTLKLFFETVMSVYRLSNIKKVSTTMRISLTNMKFNGTSPSEEDKSSFLHKIRPLILQKEITWTPNIINSLSKNIQSEQFRKLMNNLKSFFNCNDPYSIDYAIDGGKIYNDNILKLWLNAYEYHRDIDKLEELKPLIDSIGIETFEAQMMDMIILKFNATQEVARYVEVLIDDNKNNFVLNIED